MLLKAGHSSRRLVRVPIGVKEIKKNSEKIFGIMYHILNILINFDLIPFLKFPA